jgi:hypothetical protein
MFFVHIAVSATKVPAVFLTTYYFSHILVDSSFIIHQMTTQNVRGGGTVCISNAELWQSLMTFVSSVEQC